MRFYKWLGISLLIHAVVVLPLMLAAFSAPPPKPREVKLEMELFDMASIREMEETREAEAPDIPDVPAPAQPEPEAEAPPPPFLEEPEYAAAELPVEPMDEPPQPEPVVENPVIMPDSGPAPGSAMGLVAETAAGAPGGAGVFLPLAGGGGGSGIGGGGGSGVGVKDAADRRQEALRREQADEADRLNRYTSMVARRLQANLVYPANMRRKGVEAATTIAFTVTESGQIKRDSLQVRKSSGYREMDDNALRAVRESAPFDKPPRELALVIELAFEVGRSRR